MLKAPNFLLLGRCKANTNAILLKRGAYFLKLSPSQRADISPQVLLILAEPLPLGWTEMLISLTPD